MAGGEPSTGAPLLDDAPARPTRRGLTPEVALTLLFAAGGWAIGLRPLSDNSFFTHLATGRLILADGVPVRDPYSFTAPGASWTVQSWLASAYWAFAERAGGLTGVRAATALVTAVLGALVWTLTKECRSLLPRLVLAALGLFVGSYMWSSRPLLFGLVFLGVVLLVLQERVSPLWLIPTMAVWTHTHGSFPLGLVAIGAFGVGRALDDRELPRAEVQALGWAVIGTLAGVIGPVGIDRLTFPVRLLSRGEQLGLLVEWFRPSLADPWVRVFAIQVVVAAVALWRVRRWRLVLPSLTFVALALFAQRNIPSASLVLLVAAAAGLPLIGRLEVTTVPRLARPVAVISVGLVLFTGVTELRGPDLDLSTYPVDALAFVAPAVDAGGRLLTDETTGNLITLVEGEAWPIAIDDRIDMYPSNVVDDYLTVLRAEEGWGAVLEAWEIDLIVWEASRPLAGELATSEEWQVVYADGTWSAACRSGSASCAALEAPTA